MTNWYNDPDPYLIFSGPVYDITPRKIIGVIDTIRRESEWAEFGFKIKKDKYGNYKPIVKSGLYFGLTRIGRPNLIELNAIETHKKITSHPMSVYELIKQGCTFDDFVNIAEDIILYCNAMDAKEEHNNSHVLQYISNAFKINPKEVLYANLYFEARLLMGEKNAIYDEIQYFKNDLDALIHSERVYEWIIFLIKHNCTEEVTKVINIVNDSLDKLIAGKVNNRIYGEQHIDWYSHKKNEFNKNISKYL